MAETLVSPGVLARENDQSFITQGPVTVGAAIVGPTVKGPVEVPTVVTSYTDYLATFGDTLMSGSANYSYYTSIAAYNYFEQGGSSLLVTRVTSGSFTSATAEVSNQTSSVAFTLATLTEGITANSTSSLDANGALESGSRDNVRWEVSNVNSTTGTFTLLVRRGDDTTAEKTILETWNNLSLDPTSDRYIESIIGNTRYEIATDNGDTYLRTIGEYANKSRYVRVSAVNNLV